MPAKNRLSPRKRPKQARAQQTWDTILQAAAQVLRTDGYDKSTTDRIAERAGLSIGSVYEYFPNKDAIFAALVGHWNEQRWTAFQSQPRAPGETSEPELTTLIQQTIRARIAATRLDPTLNTILQYEVPRKVTAEQAQRLMDEFLNTSLTAMTSVGDQIRSGDHRLMAKIMIHATHAVIDNLADSEPELLDSEQLEKELTLMMSRYLAKEA